MYVVCTKMNKTKVVPLRTFNIKQNKLNTDKIKKLCCAINHVIMSKTFFVLLFILVSIISREV